MKLVAQMVQWCRPCISVIALAWIAAFSAAGPSACLAAGDKFTANSGADLAADSVELDVGYVPTSMDVVNAMFSLCKPGPDDFLIDLGSGDGRIVISAARQFGTRGLGVDLNQKLVALSRKYALAEGVAGRTEFRVQDIFLTDIRAADVVTMYLLPDVNLRLRPKLWAELKPGARIVSHDYHLGDWRPDKTLLLEKVTPEGDDSIVYFWRMPARVAGTWQWQVDLRGERQAFTLELEQHFQDVIGTVHNQGRQWPVFDAALEGDQIRFALQSEADGRMVRQDYEGRVNGGNIEGRVRLRGATAEMEIAWEALRSPKN